MFSRGRLLVCDIQGVGDVWTDPQIHTSYETQDFGLGNCFQEGIDKFMQVLVCLVMPRVCFDLQNDL